MAKIEKFEDIVSWQKAHELTIEIYKSFKKCNDYSFRDQIQRASISIMNNIAEGFDRSGDKQLKNFLYIAKGSCAEVRSMLSVAPELGYITELNKISLESTTISITKLLNGFIGKLDK